MRITRADLKNYPAHVRQQLEKHLGKPVSGQHKGIVTPHGNKTKKNSFCPWPTKNPAHWLHQLLVDLLGDYWYHAGGHVAHEVMLPDAPRKWRYDHCIVPYRIMVEFNGYQNHSLKEAFQRDHEKRAFALSKGYVVMDVTNKMIREAPDSLRSQLQQVISHRQTYSDTVSKVGYAYCKVTPGSQINN